MRLEIAYPFRRASDVKTAAFEPLAWRDEAACTEDDVVFDDRIVEHDRSHADQAEVADRARVQYDAMPDGHIRSHDAGTAAGRVLFTIMRDMKHAAVLDARARTDVNLVHVASQHGARPNGRIFTDRDASNHGRSRIDVRSRSDCRSNAVKGSDRH